MRIDIFIKASALAMIASAMVAPASLTAGQPAGVQAQSASSIAEWSNAVSRNLDRNLQAIVNAPLQHRRLPAGLVSLRFRLNEAGTPEGIEIVQKSGNLELDTIGRRAVTRLRNMLPLPAGIDQDQVYEANILLAPDDVERRQQLAALRQRQETLRAASGEAPVLALYVSSGSSRND